MNNRKEKDLAKKSSDDPIPEADSESKPKNSDNEKTVDNIHTPKDIVSISETPKLIKWNFNERRTSNIGEDILDQFRCGANEVYNPEDGTCRPDANR